MDIHKKGNDFSWYYSFLVPLRLETVCRSCTQIRLFLSGELRLMRQREGSVRMTVLRFCRMLSIPLFTDKNSIYFNLSPTECIKSAFIDYKLLRIKPSVSQLI